MNDDLLLIGSLDQPLSVDSDWVMDKIDEILKRSVKEKNVYLALNVCKELVAVGQVAGLALSKALYYIQKNWQRYKVDGDFDDIVYDYIGKHKHTVERYVKVWGMFDNAIVPLDHVDELQQKNIRDLIPIANAIYQGYEIDAEQWEKIVDAPDFNTVAKVIREEVKEKPPRKGSLQLFLDREGTIWAYQDNHRYFVGSLEIHIDEEPIKQAIERITKNAGILKQ